MNVLIIDGNITRDAELKEVSTKNGPNTVLRFSVAHNHWRTKETDYFECSLWGARAKALHPMITKGKRVVVSGEFETSTYQSNTGERRTSLNLSVSNVTAGFTENSAPAPAANPIEPAPELDKEIPF